MKTLEVSTQRLGLNIFKENCPANAEDSVNNRENGQEATATTRATDGSRGDPSDCSGRGGNGVDSGYAMEIFPKLEQCPDTC